MNEKVHLKRYVVCTYQQCQQWAFEMTLKCTFNPKQNLKQNQQTRTKNYYYCVRNKKMEMKKSRPFGNGERETEETFECCELRL